MAAITAADLTVTLTEVWIQGVKRHSRGTLLIPGTLTYPNNGIPLPAIASFGMQQQLDVLEIFGVDASAGTVADYVSQYDKTNHKLFLFEEEAAAAGGPLLEADTSEVPGARTYNFHAIGW